ncbi:uncharacterized protein LOC143227993 [Tachypleus tridentatus]|uniref:uncharacterized protein LOC143227993 n=1 Tax=Tachypleus tridentatus TaxID=6853 RepID=UPI003FD191C2
MDVLKMKVEPFSETEQADLLNIKLIKNEDEAYTLYNNRGADLLQQRSLQTILKFGIVKEEQQENCNEGKPEDIFVTVKTEQPHDLPKDEVISKFSVNSDDDLDNSEYGVISVKTELQQCTESRLESTSDDKGMVISQCNKQWNTASL